MRLITLEQAKAHLRVTHTAEDTAITEMIEEASDAIVNYLKSSADAFLDTSENVIEVAVPHVVRRACKVQVEDFFRNRGGKQEATVPADHGYGYLAPAVVALLYPLRDPALA